MMVGNKKKNVIVNANEVTDALLPSKRVTEI